MSGSRKETPDAKKKLMEVLSRSSAWQLNPPEVVPVVPLPWLKTGAQLWLLIDSNLTSISLCRESHSVRGRLSAASDSRVFLIPDVVKAAWLLASQPPVTFFYWDSSKNTGGSMCHIFTSRFFSGFSWQQCGFLGNVAQSRVCRTILHYVGLLKFWLMIMSNNNGILFC